MVISTARGALRGADGHFYRRGAALPCCIPEGRHYTVTLADWRDAAARERLVRVRTEVFVREQAVPPELELDGRDDVCAHVLARDAAGAPIGSGRLLPDGQVGRMAVLRAWRGTGVGAALLAALLDEARRRGLREVHLHAQSHARGFYERHGFRVEGEEYLEAGIPHVGMRAVLSGSPSRRA
jgi:predicted GNAT family N-acyltransferase